MKVKEGFTKLDVSHVYHWSIIISQPNPERFNAPVPSRQDFQNPVMLIDRLQMGLLTCFNLSDIHEQPLPHPHCC
jgi:hypothetical protein